MARIKNTNLLMYYHVTLKEGNQAKFRKDIRNNDLIVKAASTIAVKKNPKAVRDREKEREEIRLKKELEEAELAAELSRSMSKKMKGPNLVKNLAVNLKNQPGICDNIGEMKDFEGMLKKIDMADDDEEEWTDQDYYDKQTKDIPRPDDWTKKRVFSCYFVYIIE
jgi:hypothetical protein